MVISLKTPFSGLNPTLINHKQPLNAVFPFLSCKIAPISHQTRYRTQGYGVSLRGSHKCCTPVCAVLSGTQDVGVSSSSQFDEFSVMASCNDETGELRISVEVLGPKTRAIFDDVFAKMVAAAQPIPGFRRVKGGKTPDIPRDILLEILGPSKVYKEVIKKVINSTVANYVEKEGLKVSKDLRIEQSLEDLEDAFEPDETFMFDAVVLLQRNS